MASAPVTASETSTLADESWIVIDDWAPSKDELDESVLNPMSTKERSLNSFRHRLRRLTPKQLLPTPSTEKGAKQQCQESTSKVTKLFGRLRSRSALKEEKKTSQDERFLQRQRSSQRAQSNITIQQSVVRSSSVPAVVQSGSAEGLPPDQLPQQKPQHRAAVCGVNADTTTDTNTASANVTSKVMSELKAKDRELAQLQLMLEMKDQEGHKHKLNVEKLQRQIEQLSDKRVQQRIASDKKVELVKKDGEMKMTQIKQELNEEQTKSQQKEQEIDQLKRHLEELQLHVSQQEDMLQSQEELLCSFQASSFVEGSYASQVPPQPADLKSITINFPDKFIARLIACHPLISCVVDDVAKSNGVSVNFVTDDKGATNKVNALLSGTEEEVAWVEQEILSLKSRLQIDVEAKTIELSCMFAPLLLLANVVSALKEIEESQFIEISVIQGSRTFVSIEEFSSHVTPTDVGKPMCVADLIHFSIPNVLINVNYDWKVKKLSGQVIPLSADVNKHLNDFYNSSGDNKTTFVANGETFVADVSSLQMTNVSSGLSITLVMEEQQPTWSYAIDANNFIDHETSDSQALENLYRYGGSFITMAGTKHTLDLSNMEQIDLKTGARVTVKRCPALFQCVAPEFNLTLSVRGLGDSLVAGVKAVQQKLESFLTSCTVTNDFMTAVPQNWREIISIQVYNAARQYCLKIGPCGIDNDTLKMQLQGAKGLLEKAQVTLKEHCLELQHHVISQALVPQVPPVSVQNPILASDIYPPEWKPQNNDIELSEVQKGSTEWTNIDSRMKKTIRNVALVFIHRIQNKKLWDKYALESKHMAERNNGQVNEQFLFHGTRATDPLTIIESVRGIDFRYSRRDYQLLWGTGAYFAVNASYSDNYCYVNQDYRVKEMLLVRVLTGNSCSYGQVNDPNLTKPPPLSQGNPDLYDTVNGHTNGSDVYVVYDHDRAYPAYLIGYLS